LDQVVVHSCIAHRLGIKNTASNKDIQGIVEVILDAAKNFEEPLTKERLLQWYAHLMQGGKWRGGPVYVVSGQLGDERIHFEAPKAARVDREMQLFFDWFNNEKRLDPVLKAAIAHLWFITIHPFDDGNGRIARAIADLMLARSENSSRRFYSLSAQIQKERKGYYAILEKTQKGPLNITPWIKWFLNCLKKAIEEASALLSIILYKTQFWESIADLSLNQRQKKVLNCLLDRFNGKLTTTKWAKIAKCSQDTAYRDILDLIDKNILVKNPKGGRSTSYSLSSSYR
jgi:Fic family protein